MFIDVSKIVCDLNGVEAPDPSGDGKPLYYSTVIVNALLNQHQMDATATGEEKFKWFKLATKIHGRTDLVEITVEEAAMIKKRVSMFYSPLVVGLVFSEIENAGAPKKPKNGAEHAEDAPRV